MGCCCSSDNKVRNIKITPRQNEEDDTENVNTEKSLDDGPLKNRGCRDIIFLIFFILYMMGMIYVAYLGITQGDPFRVIYGVDSFGNTCNRDNSKISGVELSGRQLSGKKKLFYLDPAYIQSRLPEPSIPSLKEEFYISVCIERCPDTVLNTSSAVDDFKERTGVNLCRYDEKQHVDNDKTRCPSLEIDKHISIFNRCVPKSLVESTAHLVSKFTSEFSGLTLGKNAPQKIVSDMKRSWREIGYMCALSIGVSLLIVFMMWLIAAIIIWVLVIATAGLSVAGCVYSWYSWYSLKTDYDELPSSKQTEEGKEKVETWLIYAAIATVITIIVLLILISMRSRIALVVQLFTEAGRAIRCVPLLLLQPVWTLIALLGLVVALASVAVYIETSGMPHKNNSTGTVQFKMEAFWDYIRWYHYFGMLWTSAFVIACQDVVVAGAVAMWYFKRDKSQLGWPIFDSTNRLIKYHLGSVAFGSFIIALVRWIRLVLGYIQSRLRGKSGKTVEYILKCLSCCLWCFEKFLAYINRNAYIEIAIYGHNFCKAAQKAFLLITANVLRVAAINSIGDFVLFLGKICTVLVVLIAGNELLKNRNDINYIWVPLTAAGAFAFVVSHSFLLIYEITIDTIFLCFCEDCERNDGVTKPYYMSKGLMKYLDDTSKEEMKMSRKGEEESELSTV